MPQEKNKTPQYQTALQSYLKRYFIEGIALTGSKG